MTCTSAGASLVACARSRHGDGSRMGCARDFFEAARAAAMDADRISRQLRAMDEERSGSAGLATRVRSTPDPDAIGRRLAATEEQRDRLERRQAADYRIIDRACELLYGSDSDAGLWSLVGWPADAIYHHYLGLRTWDAVGAMMLYSPAHVRREAYAAMELVDANGFMWTARGRGMAEDERT